VPEGESPDCIEGAGSPHAIDPEAPSEPAQESNATELGKPSQQGKTAAKPAKRVNAKAARSHPLPSFLRKVDLFLSARR
jgi:hypothetical protein